MLSPAIFLIHFYFLYKKFLFPYIKNIFSACKTKISQTYLYLTFFHSFFFHKNMTIFCNAKFERTAQIYLKSRSTKLLEQDTKIQHAKFPFFSCSSFQNPTTQTKSIKFRQTYLELPKQTKSVWSASSCDNLLWTRYNIDKKSYGFL